MAFARYYQRAKNGIHALQALIIFIGALITIAIFTKGGQGDGRINYYFVLCLLCIPALIYQAAVPTFPRTKRFANAYTHAAIDGILTILWFAAFIGIAVWVKDGSHAAKDWKDGDSLCQAFAWGPVSKCKLGQGTTGLGVIVCILFALTTGFSIYGVLYFRNHGYIPGANNERPLPHHDEETDDLAFSAQTYDKLDQQRDEEMQRAHPTPQNADDTLPFHNDPEQAQSSQQPSSWDRYPSPVSSLQPSLERTDTTYHGWNQEYYPSRPHPPAQSIDEDTSYDHHRVGSGSYTAVPKPPRAPIDTGDPFRDGLGLSHDHGGYAGAGRGRVDFPEGAYGR